MPIDLFLQLGIAAAPVAKDLFAGWRRRRAAKHAAPGGAAPAPVAISLPDRAPPVPADWARWAGARPEIDGAPSRSILAVPGLYTTSPAFRAGLLDLCAELSVPVDGLAAVMSSEAGFKPDALNPLPAAGLIQLTLGARLPGFDTADKIREITTWTPEKQLQLVIGPYYRRMAGKVKGASPGRLYMLNFLPIYAGEGEAFVLARKDADQAPEAANASPDDLKKLRFSAAVYRENPGFDRAKKGSITVGDVYDAIAKTCAAAKGRRVAVDGTIIETAASAPSPKKSAASAPDPASAGPDRALDAPAPDDAALAVIRGGIVAAWARKSDAITWVPLQVGEYRLQVSAEPLTAGGRRIPVSFGELVTLCKGAEFMPTTTAICDARWAQAVRRIVLAPPGLPEVDPAKAAVQALAWDRAIGPLGATLAEGPWKDWILDADMGPGKAVNFGFRKKDGSCWQPVGRRHNTLHKDYSQLQTVVKRAGLRAGEPIDVLQELARGCSLGGPLPAWLVGALK